ncbi:MAG TPA: hypothetical protein VK116_10095, partial [Planctomycetota bacterium]|nr:hypothetical protein [Planctomycetota bacterium]
TFHPGRSGAREVIFVLAFHSQRPSLIAIEDGLPDVAPPVEVSVAQTTSEPDARIEFRPGPNVDATEILRDDTLIATLAPQVTAFIDRGVAPGKRRYRLRSVRGERRSEERVVSLQVGPGSIADRELTHPVSLVAAVASRPGLTPDLDEWIVSSTSFAHGDELHVFDRDLRRTRAIPSPFARPLRPALLTVRTNASGDEIFVLGWASGAASDMTELPVEVIDPEGRRLRRFAFRPPPPRGHSVAFPTGLAYREASDTLFYYDRNSAMLTELDPSGFILRTFEQPVAPFDHRVVALGLGVHPLTGSLWVASAGRGEERASRIVELALGGKATGAEIHLDLAVGQDPRGFAFDRDGASFVVPSVTSGLGELIRYRAFDLVSPVADLSCAIEGVVGEGTLRARLIWRNTGAYEAVEVYRGTELAVVLEGDAEQWVDLDPPGCGGFWRVVPVRDGARAAGSICDRPALRPFVRGDVEENGSINISDAVRILEHLFLGGNEPACLDAADV